MLRKFLVVVLSLQMIGCDTWPVEPLTEEVSPQIAEQPSGSVEPAVEVLGSAEIQGVVDAVEREFGGTLDEPSKQKEIVRRLETIAAPRLEPLLLQAKASASAAGGGSTGVFLVSGEVFQLFFGRGRTFGEARAFALSQFYQGRPGDLAVLNNPLLQYAILAICGRLLVIPHGTAADGGTFLGASRVPEPSGSFRWFGGSLFIAAAGLQVSFDNAGNKEAILEFRCESPSNPTKPIVFNDVSRGARRNTLVQFRRF